MTMEDCEPQPASFGVCLSPEWQIAGMCIMKSHKCSDEDEEEATSSRRLLGAILNAGQGTFKYYTKVAHGLGQASSFCRSLTMNVNAGVHRRR